MSVRPVIKAENKIKTKEIRNNRVRERGREVERERLTCKVSTEPGQLPRLFLLFFGFSVSDATILASGTAVTGGGIQGIAPANEGNTIA